MGTRGMVEPTALHASDTPARRLQWACRPTSRDVLGLVRCGGRRGAGRRGRRLGARSRGDVVAVERDARCIPALHELASAFPGQLEIVEGDATAVDARALAGDGAHILANLPYNVGTHLLVGWLSDAWLPWWASLTLMFQQEVAERIVATTGSEHYGRLAVLAQWRSTARIAMKVHRSAFTPPPKVMSAVVHIVPAPEPEGVRLAVLEQVTAAAFGQRRKMLRQSLKGVKGALDALAELGIDAQRRAETVSVPEFVAIARLLSASV